MKNTDAIHGTPKQPRKPLCPPRTQLYVYHWDRIIGAGFVILVLVGLAGYGLFLWSESSPKEGFDMAENPPKAEVAVEETRSRLEEESFQREIKADPRSFTHAEKDGLPPTIAETADSNSNSQNTQTPLLDEAIIEADNPAQQFAAINPLETEPPSPELAQLSTANQNKEATVEELSEPQAEIPQNIPFNPQGESPDSADTTLTVETLNSPFQSKEVEILEPSIKRFLLAGSVSNREPKGELNEISFTADGSAAVWVYSEIIDKKGSRFKYVWLHGGNQIATVPINVGGNRWRSYSSKLINQSMSGAWRVELQDGKGRLMASADFFLE